jgi:queuine tRNA-ribosyltransferase
VIAFEILHSAASGARTGLLGTAHGTVQTPAFMPVGTYGTVRGLTPAQLREAGTEMVLANAYHLALRPGAETISKLGGLHRFMGWKGPILTDSGGYQLYSLAEQASVTERGAVFRSHVDGARFELTAERVVEIQRLLGVDVGMVFDVLTGRPGDRQDAAEASARTLRWAGRTQALLRTAPSPDGPAFFAIVQGGLFEDLRRESAGSLVEMGFPGYAVGGLSVGEPIEDSLAIAETTAALLPEASPRYMMGMGTPTDLVELAGWGYDLFDCVIPTRNGRNGTLFTRDGPISIRNAVHALDERPVDGDCDCYGCRTYSRAYLHHLAKRKEMLAPILGSLHNVRFYQRLMAEIRSAIAGDAYARFREAFLTRFAASTEEMDR